MTVTDIYSLVQSQPFDIGPTEEARVDLVLKRPPPVPVTQLFGIVLAETCEPISRATVKVLDRAYNPVAHTLTDQDGRYDFCNVLPPGAYKLTAAADGYLTAKTKDCLLKSGSTEYIGFELKKTSMCDHAAVYGLTLGAMLKAPLADTVLVLCDSCGNPCMATKSNEQGQYLLTMVPPGQYVLTASHNGFQTKSISVLAEKNSILKSNILLEKCTGVPSGTISGLIMYNFSPLANAVVGLYRIDGAEEMLIKLGLTNREGLYLFTGMDSGCYRVKSTLGIIETYQKEFQI